MAYDRKYSSEYEIIMRDRKTEYNLYIRRATQQNRDNGGEPTMLEAEFYEKARAVCQEIMNQNLRQESIYKKWKMLREEADDKARRIRDALSPKPAEPERATVRENEAVGGSRPASDYVAPAADPNFATKNACKEVSADTISRWYIKERPKHCFADVQGMEDAKEQLGMVVDNVGFPKTDSAVSISPVQSFFFYGPPGTGKTFVIEAFASEMMELGYKYIRLLGADIHAGIVGVAEKTVKIAFQEAIDNEPCIIFIDEIENVCVNRARNNAEGHATRLTVAFLEAYNLLKSSNKRVIFLGATNFPDQVDNAMFDRITPVRVALPNQGAREKYFAAKFKKLTLEDGITTEDMATATEGYSFRDLDRIVEYVNWITKRGAIDLYAVYNEDGTMNRDATDDAASEALLSGEIQVKKETFDMALEKRLPSDKADCMAALDKFEAGLKGNG